MTTIASANTATAIFLASLMFHNCGPACAESVAVEVARDGRTLHVEAVDAPIAVVLAKVREFQSFDLEQHAELAGTRITSTVSGPTRFVIEQILIDTNYLIHTNVRTRDVERLVVLGPRTDPSEHVPAVPIATPATGPMTARGNGSGLVGYIQMPRDRNAVHSPAIARPPMDVDTGMSSRRQTRKASNGSSAAARARRRA